MRAATVADAEAFAALAGPFLAADEAEHSLALGLLGRLLFEPRVYGHDPLFVVALEGADVVGCLLRTPPHGVVLSRFASLDAVAAVADCVREVHPELPGAVGPNDVAARFAECWAARAGVRAEIGIRQRVHAASSVNPIRPAPGRMRTPGPADEETVVSWIAAFAEEALGAAGHVESAEATYRRIAGDPHGAWVLWDDGGPVSLAAFGSRTATGVRIGPVYTPPEHRGKGYATSLVSEITSERLRSGLDLCFLFTDLANPTSNAIYSRIGYDPVADWDQWAFTGLQP